MGHQPSVRDVVGAVHEILVSSRGHLDARLNAVLEGEQVGHILNYFTQNIDVGMYHLLMIEQTDETANWIANPDIADMQVSLVIWGLVRHDRDELFDPLVGELAAGVKDALNRRHHPIAVGPWWIYFNEVMPIGRISYGAAPFGSAIVRGFMAEYRSSISYQLREEQQQGTSLKDL